MIDNKQIIKVGIADLNVVKPPFTIRTSGLGSCVGIILFDEHVKIGGMAHIMLPASSLSRTESINPAKYADTAITELLARVVEAGANRVRLKAKIAGGAQMFQFQSASDMMRIGPRNVEAVMEQLSLHQIALVATDVGGNSGRTIEFSPESSILTVRTVNKGIIEI